MSLLALLFLSAVVYCRADECPPCPAAYPACEYFGRYTDPNNEKCSCEYCDGPCLDSFPCPKGTTCSKIKMSCPVDKKQDCFSTVCAKFTKCEKKTCETKCPKTGYAKDPNGCRTCLCKDPCKELCRGDQTCTIALVPSHEYEYGCSDK